MAAAGASTIDWPVFIAITVIVFGFVSFMTGRALAATWRSIWWILPYSILLGLVDRFFTWALFDGVLLSPVGYLADTLVLLALSLTAYRMTQVRKMVRQYPWLYARSGPFAWRRIEPFGGPGGAPDTVEKN